MRIQHLILALTFIGLALLLAPQTGLMQDENLSCTPLIEEGFAQL
jgi:hypothetical protein